MLMKNLNDVFSNTSFFFYYFSYKSLFYDI
uniref:Uncharacterized protein n=1 Tax=Myoviridae sp. ctNQV2 TaxID=2827683 RepID=A0A8S5RZF8_9CAUD|nr:MAG TPA: hypothetical protein [Myoviridae sp. ctNQV2]